MDLVVLGEGSDIEHSLLGSDDRGLLRSGGCGLLGCLASYAADGIFFRLSGPLGFLSDLICVDARLSG